MNKFVRCSLGKVKHLSFRNFLYCISIPNLILTWVYIDPYFFVFTLLQVSTNGLVSFDGPLPEYTGELFPLGREVIAPFYADVDIRTSGDVFYRYVPSITSSACLFDLVLVCGILQSFVNFSKVRDPTSWLYNERLMAWSYALQYLLIGTSYSQRCIYLLKLTKTLN